MTAGVGRSLLPVVRQANAGFSLLELCVVGFIAMVLLSVGAWRYTELQMRAESEAHTAVLAALHTALTLKATEIALRQGAGYVRALEGSNPFDLLSEQVSNYAGELPLSGELKTAAWYYSSSVAQVVYVWRWVEGSAPVLGAGEISRYRVQVPYGAGGVDGVSLAPLGTKH